MRPSLLQSRVDDLRLVVRGRRELTVDEFEAHIAEAADMQRHVRAVLVSVPDGARFSPAFRAKLLRTGLAYTPHAVVTDSFLARAEATSVRRIGGNIQIFRSSELEQALDHLSVPVQRRPDVRARLVAMQEALLDDAAE